VNPSRESERARRPPGSRERLNFSLLKRFCDGAAAEIRQGNKVGAAACVSESRELLLLFQPRAAVCEYAARAAIYSHGTGASVSFPRH